ncbi:solute carrier family 25 member 32 isoform X1 [Hydra vulgaris]|uniref:solute carrier family 25 member 32 isoform X1 n=1 Tax=Hydra vulgaris TaxID=6087 RepID=UPI001F5F1A7D|nr:mitochondrial folate transporter/carrier [Hydra vulgaris]
MSWFENLKIEHLIAGLSGGVVSTLVLHPFDLIKVRFQVNDGSLIKSRETYSGMLNAFSQIIKKNGFQGLYQGVSANVAGAGSSWGLYFFMFNYLKSTFRDIQKVDNLSPGYHLLCGFIAGASTLTVTNPIWVIKTRMCLQVLPETNSLMQKEYYTGVLDGLKKLYMYEGIRGYYRGFVPGLFGVSHGAIQFMSYEELKKLRSKITKKPVNSKLNSLEYIAMAASSKFIAVTITYPYQVLRSRMQDTLMQDKYNGVADVFIKIYRNEGITGFYKGLVPSVIRVTPACCITFLVYENISHYLLPNLHHS